MAVDTVEASLKIASQVVEHFPGLTVVARARNRRHAYQLLALGIHHVFRETLASSVELTERVLRELGLPFDQAHETMVRFREIDERMLLESYAHLGDAGKLQELAGRAREELESLFKGDEERIKSA